MTTATQSKARTIRFKIKRSDGPGKPSYWQTFNVPVIRGEASNVISCLQHIAANPTTADGTATTPVAWKAGCLEEVCGACTMVINGKVRQSCSCMMDTVAPNDGDTITLEPMRKFPVIRDLFVDRARLFESLKRVKAWVPTDNLWDLGAGPIETPEQHEVRYKLSECMSCGCCMDACPQFHKIEDDAKWQNAFIGAAPISQVRYFNLHETGATLKTDRLNEMAAKGGVSDCGNAQNCVKHCPKSIPLTESIAAVGRDTTIHAIKQFFTGK